MINKFDEVKLFLSKHKWSFIFVSETWFTEDVEMQFSLENYQLFCMSRTKKTGGGSAVYVQEDIVTTQLSLFQFSTAEAVFLKVNIDKHRTCLLIQIYRAPKNNIEFLSELEKCLVEATKLNVLTYIVGDFNADLFSISDNSFNESFFTLMCSFGFLPTISKATRVSNGSFTLIDNMFCNDLSVLHQSGVIMSDFSDHFSIFSSSKIYLEKNIKVEEYRTSFDYSHIDALKEFLANELENLHTVDNAEDACNKLIDSYTEGVAKFSRKKRLTRKNNTIQPWVTPGLLNSINQKNILFSAKLKYPTTHNISRYNTYRNCLNSALRNAKKRYFKLEFAKHRNNPKQTWETLNQLLQKKTSNKELPNKFVSDLGEDVENDISISKEFNQYFAEIGQKLKNKITTSASDPIDNLEDYLGDIMVVSPTTENEVEEIISGLNDVGAGKDSINSKICKGTYKSILPQLVYFFNLCLRQAVFPTKLKVAVIKPIFKTGDPTSFSNYRPISILPFLSKILEKIIYIRLLNHFTSNELLSYRQFGFRKGLSTFMPILLIQDLITKAFEEDKYVVGIFLDLKKAFDTVDHNILCKKLKKYGVFGKAFEILESYLRDRTQSVNIRGTHADVRDIEIGVPQGSILGPLLFIIYINDLANVDDKGKFFIYADDTAVFFQHNDPNILQNIVDTALPKISTWLQSNFLSLNASKTIYQVYSKRKVHINIHVQINNNVIEKKQTVKYLGMLIDDDLKFKSHINTITNTVSRNVGMMSRVKYFVEAKQLICLYNAIILPYINYCCIIWGTGYAHHTKKLLTLQKRAMRIMEGIYPPQSANPIFKKYNILKIQDIAKMQMLLVMHKHICNQLPQPITDMFTMHIENNHGTRQNKHFQVTFSTKNYRLFTIACLGPKLWNSIMSGRYTRDEVPHSKDIVKKSYKKLLYRKVLGAVY